MASRFKQITVDEKFARSKFAVFRLFLFLLTGKFIMVINLDYTLHMPRAGPNRNAKVSFCFKLDYNDKQTLLCSQSAHEEVLHG